MSEWQPIETGPKDGTDVMLFPHYVVSSWSADLGYWWLWDDRADMATKHHIKFTHWMPLPPPPEQK